MYVGTIIWGDEMVHFETTYGHDNAKLQRASLLWMYYTISNQHHLIQLAAQQLYF